MVKQNEFFFPEKFNRGSGQLAPVESRVTTAILTRLAAKQEEWDRQRRSIVVEPLILRQRLTAEGSIWGQLQRSRTRHWSRIADGRLVISSACGYSFEATIGFAEEREDEDQTA